MRSVPRLPSAGRGSSPDRLLHGLPCRLQPREELSRAIHSTVLRAVTDPNLGLLAQPGKAAPLPPRDGGGKGSVIAGPSKENGQLVLKRPEGFGERFLNTRCGRGLQGV